jgi:hypothetical protein
MSPRVPGSRGDPPLCSTPRTTGGRPSSASGPGARTCSGLGRASPAGPFRSGSSAAPGPAAAGWRTELTAPLPAARCRPITSACKLGGCGRCTGSAGRCPALAMLSAATACVVPASGMLIRLRLGWRGERRRADLRTGSCPSSDARAAWPEIDASSRPVSHPRPLETQSPTRCS